MYAVDFLPSSLNNANKPNMSLCLFVSVMHSYFVAVHIIVSFSVNRGSSAVECRTPKSPGSNPPFETGSMFWHLFLHDASVHSVWINVHLAIDRHCSFFSVRRLGATPLDFHRPPGPPRYAQQPLGNYTPQLPPGCSQMGAPPTAVVAPSQAGAPSGAVYTPGLFSGMTSQSATLPSGGVPLSYTPVTHHWFYAEFIELRLCWKPFSVTDSVELEDAFQAGKYNFPRSDIACKLSCLFV